MRSVVLLLLTACGASDRADGDDTDTDALVPSVDEALADDCRAYDPGTGTTRGTDLWKVTLDAPGAVCNDGSPAVMYVRPSTGGENADRWVFYLQGGDQCSDAAGCAIRWCGTQKYTKAKMSTRWTSASAGAEALLARDGTNPFGDANQVLLYYCSSDSWRGTKADSVLTDETTGRSMRLQFRGHDIVVAAIEALLAGPVRSDGGDAEVPSLSDAGLVIWTGSSAGAHGAELHADWVAEQLPRARVVAWFDANLPIVYDDLGPQGAELATYDETVRWPEVAQGAYGAWLEPSCVATHGPDDLWLCGNNEHVVLNHVTTPFFVRQDLQDPVIGGRLLELGATKADMATAWAKTLARVPRVAAEGEEAMTVVPGVYGPNCGQHVGLSDDAWFRQATVEDEDGVALTHRGAFAAWFQGEPVSIVDTQPSTRSTCPAKTDGGG